jgi:predicted RNase H-like HicB family nuclease
VAIDHYAVRIWWSEEDGYYLAQIEELEGCLTHGRTREEALREVQVSAAAWLEFARDHGWPIPEPNVHKRQPAAA